MSYNSIVPREVPAAIITLNRPERRNAISLAMPGGEVDVHAAPDASPHEGEAERSTWKVHRAGIYGTADKAPESRDPGTSCSAAAILLSLSSAPGHG